MNYECKICGEELLYLGSGQQVCDTHVDDDEEE